DIVQRTVRLVGDICSGSPRRAEPLAIRGEPLSAPRRPEPLPAPAGRLHPVVPVPGAAPSARAAPLARAALLARAAPLAKPALLARAAPLAKAALLARSCIVGEKPRCSARSRAAGRLLALSVYRTGSGLPQFALCSCRGGPQMSSIEVRPFRRGDRDQLTRLVNAHAEAVVPGMGVSVSTVLTSLERQPGEFIEDPWVGERAGDAGRRAAEPGRGRRPPAAVFSRRAGWGGRAGRG